MANTLRFKRGLASGIPTALAGEPLFTTDTFDLYIGNGTTNTRFQKYIASGATTQILRGDGSLYTFPLAISSPSNGQVLKYNGTSWVNDSDAGITGSLTTNYLPKATGATTLGNSLVFDNGTNVGINTITPAARFSIVSNTAQASNDIITQINYGSIGASVVTKRALYIDAITASAFDIANSIRHFETGDVSLTAGTNRYVYGSYYGIKLGGLTTTGVSGIPTPHYQIYLGNMAGVSDESMYGIYIGTIAGGGNSYGIHSNVASGTTRWNLYMNGTAKNYMNGNLLIGSTSDSGEKLQVTGTMKVTGASSFGGNMTLTTTTNYAFSIVNSGTNAASLNYSNASGAFYMGIDSVGGGAISGTTGYARLIWGQGAYPLLFATNNVERMRLDASGNLGLGVTPSAWANTWTAFQNKTGAWMSHPSVNYNYILANTYYDGSNYRYVANGYATQYTFSGLDGLHAWYNAPSGTAGNAITFTQAMTLDASGNLGLGTASPNRRLRVASDGLNWISGVFAGSGGADVVVIGNLNGASIGGHNSALNSWAQLAINPDGGNVLIGQSSPNNVLIGTSSDSGEKLQVNGTAKITGAATFSSSVTSNGNMLIQKSQPQIQLYQTGADHNYSILGNTNTALEFWHGTFGSNTTKMLSLAGSTGAATFSSSIEAATAIAIGTTPDTNNPFKILKNINATVGIKFENTNTSSSAFSAVQLGTDVSGGTKFTNLVYSSSGVTASGVYQPDGTSLINNGNGGLNFLGNPIRFYTGGSNGVLRLYFDNEGTTQFNATSPTTSITDGFRQYSADVTAGNAAPHFRTENGAVIKLYQETTSVGNSIFSQGGGNSVLDDSTFDGYTLRQIVKALRNQGILA
jgi:hypothetical protein